MSQGDVYKLPTEGIIVANIEICTQISKLKHVAIYKCTHVWSSGTLQTKRKTAPAAVYKSPLVFITTNNLYNKLYSDTNFWSLLYPNGYIWRLKVLSVVGCHLARVDEGTWREAVLLVLHVLLLCTFHRIKSATSSRCWKELDVRRLSVYISLLM